MTTHRKGPIRTAVCARDSALVTQPESQGWRVLGRETYAIPPANVVSHAALLRGMQLRAEVVRSWA
ncbi:MAG: hypothetical protein ACXVES_10310, partial [Actinomycetota bacterium]